MPVFHTKTIESILDPVAQQVSRLVIIHEEGEAGHEMPDLQKPVMAVSKAVSNLAKVGREMGETTEDGILKQDMPLAIAKVENAATLLEEASSLSKVDPYSKAARTKLIEGSRWILQGTSNVLLCFDESEVRKIIKECKKVLDYLSVAEVIESMEDLVQFVKDLSPCLSKVTREVEKRVEDLTHQVHRETLSRCVEQIKTLAPILICSMKIFIQILSQGGKGTEEAGENRNYLASRMTDEVSEIVRVLQLVTYDEEEWSSDNIAVMKKTVSGIEGKMQQALDWLRDPTAMQGGIGEKALRSIIDMAGRLAEKSLPLDAEHLRRLGGDVSAMTDALCELRAAGRGTTPQAETLARNIQSRVGEVAVSCGQAVSRLEKSGIAQPAPTMGGRIEQARRWLEQPGVDDRGVGQQAVQLILEEAAKVADGLGPGLRDQILGLADRVGDELNALAEAGRQGEAGGPQSMAMARSLAGNLSQMADLMQGALVNRVINDFVDIATPLKQFTDCVLHPGDPASREQVLENKSAALVNFSNRAVGTAKMVAVGNTSGNKKLAEALLAAATQVDSLTPQLLNAGRIRMVYPENKAADEHFENLRRQYAETVTRAKGLVDEATDSARFIGQTHEAMAAHTDRCEEAIATKQPAMMVESTSNIARLANRVLQLTKQEAENSEDVKYIATLNISAEQLQSRVSPMVQFAKGVALNVNDPVAINGWRKQNKLLLDAVEGVHRAVETNQGGEEQPPIPPYPDVSSLRITEDGEAPPRPPPPASVQMGQYMHPSRPPPPDTDDEAEFMFENAPDPSQGPIMLAAHDLHQEVKQWSSKDNDIIAAAKKMALMMAKLSQLVQEDSGSKRELISIAKAIAESSDEVTRLAKELAKECTDKRMRTNLLQVCERIPTIGTQLKILSTVKATMLGAQGTEEDIEATEMLVGNAQNLMQSVKQTVTAAEAASIKIRTDAGIRVKWVRKQPWYQY